MLVYSTFVSLLDIDSPPWSKKALVEHTPAALAATILWRAHADAFRKMNARFPIPWFMLFLLAVCPRPDDLSVFSMVGRQITL